MVEKVVQCICGRYQFLLVQKPTGETGHTELKAFYSQQPSLSQSQEYKTVKTGFEDEILTGSNGFAFAPSVTESGNAILYINPHVTFYFRPEVHMVSEEGLNVYGAVTWGQFFIYQGFNEHCGWMHTSSAADVIDEYLETVIKSGNHFRSHSFFSIS